MPRRIWRQHTHPWSGDQRTRLQSPARTRMPAACSLTRCISHPTDVMFSIVGASPPWPQVVPTQFKKPVCPVARRLRGPSPAELRQNCRGLPAERVCTPRRSRGGEICTMWPWKWQRTEGVDLPWLLVATNFPRCNKIFQYTANPTWGDIFECCFKAQSSKLEHLFSLKRGKKDFRALSFRKCHPKWDWLYCLVETYIYFRGQSRDDFICSLKPYLHLQTACSKVITWWHRLNTSSRLEPQNMTLCVWVLRVFVDFDRYASE